MGIELISLLMLAAFVVLIIVLFTPALALWLPGLLVTSHFY